MSSNSIQDTITQVANAMNKNVSPLTIRQVLMSDGFKPKQIETMICWARKIRQYVIINYSNNTIARIR